MGSILKLIIRNTYLAYVYSRPRLINSNYSIIRTYNIKLTK